MTLRLLILLLISVGIIRCQQALAQGTFPAPLPNQAQTSDPTFSPSKDAGNGSIGFLDSPLSGSSAPAAAPSDDCTVELVSLRGEAEQRSRLIKAASDRHAPPDEACRLIGSFEQAEAKMVKYVETHAHACGISVQVSDQLKSGHENTKRLLQKVCALAEQVTQQPAGKAGPDMLGPAPTAPTRVWPPNGPTGDFESIK
ncbi:MULTISPECIES: hypothetical protein [unclassified Bradyrhizobium]|uniref:hypothetical protein n=1 Tax=unclassified Bradyrhizobium TaxID=2631580 RepID=UPI00291657A6|nr:MULTISPECIES: hypothetical protein [unclassified Bradyrhizobium]